jgi:hypothetical protein
MEKYKTYLHFLSAKIYKDFRRYQISKLIYWDTPAPTEPEWIQAARAL